MATWDMRRLQQALEKKKPNNLYLVYGEETYLVNEAVKSIRQACLKDGAADFNYDQFFVGEADACQIKDTVEMLPMMCERRVVVLRGVDNLKEKDWEKLLPLLEKPWDSCCFVLVAGKVDKRKKYFKVAAKNAAVVELKRPYDNQVAVWIEYIAYNHQLELTKDAVATVHQLVGSNLGEINNEMLKLSQYLGDVRRADVTDVLKVISKSRIDSVFDLTDAIGRKDRGRALIYLANLLEHGQNEIGVMTLILRHVRILSMLREGMSEGLAGQRLSTKAGIPNFFLKQYLGQCSLWDERKIRTTINALHKTDLALKSSPVSSHIWLENFIIQTC